ncbi:MAG TPA: 30S ribosomal protein S6 [Rhodospirillaceae bacterium]|nr:30S ribosomal protein S6 [Rhodospirillaceae bacterium]
MPYYESVFIARQDIQTAQVETLTGAFAEIIKANGGEVKKTEQWGLRNLAYRIRKNKKGHYVMFNLEAPAEAVAEMERNMRLNEDILRFLTVKVDELEEGPSVMMRREERDNDRGGNSHQSRPLRQTRAPREASSQE